MEQHTVQQIRAATELIEETVAGTVALIATTQQSIARQPYAILALIPGIAGPVRMIEQIQHGITETAYRTILSVNQIVASAAASACDALERDAD